MAETRTGQANISGGLESRGKRCFGAGRNNGKTVAAEPASEPEKPLLKQTLGEISKASGKIIRVDD